MAIENLKCLFCDGELAWDSDSNASDSFGEYEEDDTAVVTYYHCEKCGRDYEICEPPREERESTYKDYWK